MVLENLKIAKLNWEDINIDGNKIKVLDSKGGKDRIVYFDDELRKALMQYRKIKSHYKGSVVRGSFGKRITSGPI